mmetsp:Transcript_62273/g.197166  ORF Transcript_62273/g.197166 Transcript_62273/m.197166 type:complete len:312 (+) Transcript_62273:382-1317(+)
MYDSVMDNFISRSARPSRSPRDHRADALVGENLLEEGVGLAAIDDVRGADTLGKGPDAALHLGDHATGEDAVGDELPGARDVGFRDQGANIVLVHEDAGDVRHQHQLLGIQSRGDLPSRSVRVDIEGVAGRVSGNGCNHRDDVLVDQDLDDGWVNGRHLPDVSEVHIARLASAYELPILPAQANSSAALGIDQRDQGLVHVPHEHHLHHLACVRVGQGTLATPPPTNPRRGRHTSMVASSVTRSPFLNLASMPSFPSQVLISGPPPCTSTGLIPTSDIRTRSLTTPAFRVGSFIAAPPYLITIVLLWNLFR